MITALRQFSLFIFTAILLSSCSNDKKTEETAPINDPMVIDLTNKINQDPKNAKLFYDRALMLQRLHEDSLAINDYKKAISLDSTKAEYYSAIGDLLFEHKDITGSLTWLEKAVKLNPKDPRAQLKIAKMFIFINEYNKAFDAINTVLRQDVYNAEAYYLKGVTYKNIKDTAKAISSFQTALNSRPDHRESLIQLGTLYSAKADPLAIKYYESAFRVDTTDVSPIYFIGLYHRDRNDFAKAKEEFIRAIGKDKNFSDAFFGMGWILMQQDSIEKARRQFDIVTGIEPNNPDGWYNRGLCSEMLGEKQKAIADYEQALAFDPEYKNAIDGKKRLTGK